MKLILEKAEAATTHIRVMMFRSCSGEPLADYTAGSHIEFDLGSAGRRSYSLVDWPGNAARETGLYTVAVQREKTGAGGSQAMHALSVGQTITTTMPQNNFRLLDGDQPVLLLAGGIGITPMISMATQLSHDGRPFQLHYSARSASRMGFADSLKKAFSNAVNLYLDDSNPLDLLTLMQSQQPDTRVYLCGPRGMIEAARRAAMDEGLSENNIHIELFSTPDAGEGDSAFEVEISNTGQVVQVAADQSIIEALESVGIDVMYDCQRGDCGICQCDVISGIPDHRDVVLSDDERASGKVMQICVSRAKSSRLVIDV
ncbi:MAG: 2Fe-2S iron-sulfur cluster-binding protein [Granulosicoccus sp.]